MVVRKWKVSFLGVLGLGFRVKGLGLRVWVQGIRLGLT